MRLSAASRFLIIMRFILIGAFGSDRIVIVIIQIKGIGGKKREENSSFAIMLIDAAANIFSPSFLEVFIHCLSIVEASSLPNWVDFFFHI